MVGLGVNPFDDPQVPRNPVLAVSNGVGRENTTLKLVA
jgi:hypothetical protein